MPYPAYIEKSKEGEKAYDVYSRMMKDRIVFMTGVVDEDMANHLVASLLLLESQNDKAPICMYVNSPGGAIVHGMAIYDTMQLVKSPIHTIVFGQACSMGSFLAQAGEKGHRKILPHARTMIHQPSGGASGMQSDIEIQYKEITKMKEMLTDLYVFHNSKGKTYEDFERDMDRDTFLSADETVAYGLADEVVTKI